MAKHLSDSEIDQVIRLIDGLSGKVTWDQVCDECYKAIGRRPTRQTLTSYEAIKSAYQIAKTRVAEHNGKFNIPSTLKMAAQKIARLEQENARLRLENQKLLEQFVVWQENAYAHGMTQVQLNRKVCKPHGRRTE